MVRSKEFSYFCAEKGLISGDQSLEEEEEEEDVLLQRSLKGTSRYCVHSIQNVRYSHQQ
jgi:hypothetical protein